MCCILGGEQYFEDLQGEVQRLIVGTSHDDIGTKLNVVNRYWGVSLKGATCQLSPWDERYATPSKLWNPCQIVLALSVE